VTGEVDAMLGSWPLSGNAGFFAITGRYWNKTLGWHRAFATDLSRAVVLRYPNRTIVITRTIRSTSSCVRGPSSRWRTFRSSDQRASAWCERDHDDAGSGDESRERPQCGTEAAGRVADETDDRGSEEPAGVADRVTSAMPAAAALPASMDVGNVQKTGSAE
jgi:hypothetical protein